MPIQNLLPILSLVGFVVLTVVVLVVGNIIGTRRFAEMSARLERQSLERGWHHQGFRDNERTVHNFSGETDHVPWQIESYNQHSTSGRGRGQVYSSSAYLRYTRWWTEAAALSGEAVLLIPSATGSALQAFGPGGTALGSMTGLAGSLIQMFLRHFVTDVLHAAPEDVQAFETIRQVQAGSDALRRQYTILATSEMTAGRFLDEDAERMLLELAPGQTGGSQKLRAMGVVYWHKGIQIIVEGQIVEIDKLEEIIRLGLALVSGQKPSAWS